MFVVFTCFVYVQPDRGSRATLLPEQRTTENIEYVGRLRALSTTSLGFKLRDDGWCSMLDVTSSNRT
jgi:hypothetical protein